MLHHPVLDRLAGIGIKLGLDQVRGFLTFLGEPHRSYPSVHIAGTNGKGSVCAYVTTALRAAGYHTGTNYSPHLEAVNERIQLDARPIGDARLGDAIEALDRARWDWSGSLAVKGEPLTYFEFLTVLAMVTFAEEQVDVGVFEVGMGGRLDATNVLLPQVCAITNIALDHMEHLGNTLEAIATEKAGILKKGVPVVIGPLPPEARAAVERRATLLGCPLWVPGPQMRREQRRGQWNLATPGGSLVDVDLAFEGEHQGANALVALGVLHRLREQGFLIPDDAIRHGFATAFLPGRIESLNAHLVVDGAHNEDGTRALARWLEARPRPGTRILLWGMGAGRDPARVIAPLLPHVDEVVTTRCAHPRALSPEELAALLQDLDVVLAEGGPIEEALPEVYAEADEVVVAGSLFLAGAARALFHQGALNGITPGRGAADPDAD